MGTRTGLGRLRQFRLDNDALMTRQIDCCRDMPIAEILALPDACAGHHCVVYALLPQCHISLRVIRGREPMDTGCTVCKPVFDRGSLAPVGELMLACTGGARRGLRATGGGIAWP